MLTLWESASSSQVICQHVQPVTNRPLYPWRAVGVPDWCKIRNLYFDMFLMLLLSCFVLVTQLHSSVNSVDSNVTFQCKNVTQAWTFYLKVFHRGQSFSPLPWIPKVSIAAHLQVLFRLQLSQKDSGLGDEKQTVSLTTGGTQGLNPARAFLLFGPLTEAWVRGGHSPLLEAPSEDEM